jgi:hypothetical protein
MVEFSSVENLFVLLLNCHGRTISEMSLVSLRADID